MTPAGGSQAYIYLPKTGTQKIWDGNKRHTQTERVLHKKQLAERLTAPYARTQKTIPHRRFMEPTKNDDDMTQTKYGTPSQLEGGRGGSI